MQNSREKLADFAGLCAWIISSATMTMIALLEYGQDFRGYYAAARVLLEGGNPYDYFQVTNVLLDVTGTAGNNPFYYPLWFGWFIAPLSFLPFQLARVAWMFFNWTIWIISLIRLRQLLDFPPKGWRAWLMNLLATFIFAWTTWKFEQTGILLFAIMVEILIAYENRQGNRMGIFLALALIKPNIMLLPVFVLGAWLIRNKNWRPILVALIVLVGLLFVTTALTPNWYEPFLQAGFGQGLTDVLDGPSRVTGTRLNTTILDWLKLAGFPQKLQNIIYAIAGIIGVLVITSSIWQSKSIVETAVVSLLVTFAITPYALQYDFPPLVIVLFWAVGRSSYKRPRIISIFIVSFVTSVLVWERPISDGYWIVIGLCVLTVWVCMTTQNNRITQNMS